MSSTVPQRTPSAYFFRYIVILCALFIVVPSRVTAQLRSDTNIAVVPFVDQVQDSSFVAALYGVFLDALDPSSTLDILEEDRVQSLMGDRGPSEVVSDLFSLAEFANRSSCAFVIGGIVSTDESDKISICIAVFSADDKAVLTEVNRTYPDQSSALQGILDLARFLSHPRYFTHSDTAFFYSLLLPGMGQLSLGKWDHALACWGLLIPAIVYYVGTPIADSYSFPRTDFIEEWNTSEEQWHFYIRNDEVTLQEYLLEYSQAKRRSERAFDEQEAVRKRKRLSSWFLASAWIINLADILLLSKIRSDGNSFFPSLHISMPTLAQESSRIIRIQLCFHF